MVRREHEVMLAEIRVSESEFGPDDTALAFKS
jgi:hypothetical protein